MGPFSPIRRVKQANPARDEFAYENSAFLPTRKYTIKYLHPGRQGGQTRPFGDQLGVSAGQNKVFLRGTKTSLIMVFFGGAKIRYKTPGPAKFRSPKAAFRRRIRPSAGQNKLFLNGTYASMKTVFWWKLKKGVFWTFWPGFIVKSIGK